MNTITRRSPRLVITICLVLLGAVLRAQVVSEQPHTMNGSQQPAPVGSQAPALEQSAGAPVGSVAAQSATPKWAPPRGLFASLYTGLAVTQALDVHSTLRALDAGHAEANPMMRWATTHPAALIGLKAATTTGTLLVVERIRKQHPKRALLIVAAIDTACALVVAHNYSAPTYTR